MKIYVPKNDEIRKRISKEIEGYGEFDYKCNRNEYEFLREISEEEYLLLSIDSKEHMVGNVLVCENNEAFILDGFGYFRVEFENHFMQHMLEIYRKPSISQCIVFEIIEEIKEYHL